MLQLAYVTVLLWFNGTLSVGAIDLRLAFVVVVTPYFLFVRFHLDRVAASAFNTFRPVLAISDAEFLRLRYELTNLPARTTRVATTVAIAVFLLNAVMLPGSIVRQYGSSFEAALLVIGPIAVSTVAVVTVSAVQAIHQLRMVERIYNLVGTIPLWRAKPLYAFSQLSARTGASFVLLAYYVAAVRPDLVSSSPALELLLVCMIPTAIACFILPLRGMHRRLAAEKDRALGEVASRLEAAFARLHERVDQEILADADKINTQIASLTAERAALERISTWPWEPATLTGFLTTLLVPTLLWGLQRVLERGGF
jgi:hypothetical protein